MAGLLDILQSPDARMALGLLAAAGPTRQPMSTGQRLQGLLAGMDEQRNAEQERALRMRMLTAQVGDTEAQAAQRLRDREAQARDEGLIRQQFAPQAGPTQDGGPVAQGAFDPRMMLGQGGSLAGVQHAMQLAQAMQPPKPKITVLKPGDTAFEDTGRKLFGLDPAPEKAPEAVRTLQTIYANDPAGLARAMQQLGQKMTTHQPATSVSVNTGQKGFDNTLKLRGDFRSEPIYKAHQEMQSAYGQIKQSLSQSSPAGDLAGATKLMKLLDPGSVVRESELGMAMAATGALDRIQYYASNILNGTKLNPTQRKDFQALADKLYSESVSQYNAKRAEYQGISERNGLNVLDVLGPEGRTRTGATATPGEIAAPDMAAINAELERRARGGK